ncbi:MAG: RnfH family protein [Motiliproteus sp.]
MNISLVYADSTTPQWLDLDIAEGSTLGEAITHSGILERFPGIDLETHKTGIFGKLAKLDQPLQAGDRVEIYTPVIVDPKTVKRRDRV